MKRALIFPTVVVWCVVLAIALRMAVADWLWLRRKRRPKPDTDYGLDDDATVTTFIGVLHGVEPAAELSPLTHHSGEFEVPGLRSPLVPAPMPAVVELGESTEPVIPEGVHGYPIGTRRVEVTLVRTGEHPAVVESTPIFDALKMPVLEVDVTCDWDRALVELEELVGV